MAILKIEKNVKNFGDAQNVLRKIIDRINKGYMQGNGWAVGKGELKHEREKNVELDNLTFEMQSLILSGEYTENLKFVDEFCTLLALDGYGMGEKYAVEKSKMEARQAQKPKDEERVELKENASGEGAQETKKGFKLPWEKNKE